MAKATKKLIVDVGRPLKPIERACLWQTEHDPKRPFVELHRDYLLNGWVISTPNLFVLARPVDRSDDIDRVMCSLVVYPPERQDCWWVELCAGRMADLWTYLPFPLEWAGWVRRGKPGFHRLERLLP